MEITDPRTQEYAERFSSDEPELLRDIANNTNAHHAHANMLSGHVQGRFLEMISILLNPKRILEIGTFVGYSALSLVKGLAPGGVLHTIELRDEDADTASRNFSRANETERIILHRGNALDIIPALNETWDIIFIDADKTGYSALLQAGIAGIEKRGAHYSGQCFVSWRSVGKRNKRKKCPGDKCF